jgi:hypothetical protein
MSEAKMAHVKINPAVEKRMLANIEKSREDTVDFR